MAQFEMTFGFRSPYQVLIDAQIIQDTEKFKMDLVGGLERTLSGKVKPSIFLVSTCIGIGLIVAPCTSDYTMFYAAPISFERCSSTN